MQIVQATPILSRELWPILNLNFIVDKIKKCYKSWRLDGFNNKYYEASWSIVSPNVINAMQKFFLNGKLLRSQNTTTITLVPKVSCPSNSGDFRPIYCSHTLYKCISKLSCSRLKCVLWGIVCQTHGAFAQGSNISHNILLCQDLVKIYSGQNCYLSCLIKVDIRKTCNTMDLTFLQDMLIALNFPLHHHHSVCHVYSVCLLVNDSSSEIFKPNSGLIQGD